jgi:hypothetical protein
VVPHPSNAPGASRTFIGIERAEPGRNGTDSMLNRSSLGACRASGIRPEKTLILDYYIKQLTSLRNPLIFSRLQSHKRLATAKIPVNRREHRFDT